MDAFRRMAGIPGAKEGRAEEGLSPKRRGQKEDEAGPYMASTRFTS